MTTRVNHTSRGNELRHRLISPTASARSDFKQLAKRGCVAELLQGRVAPISRFVSRGTSVTFHVDFNTRMHHVPRPDPVLYILVLRSRYTQPGRVSKGPVYIRTYTYIRGTNILGRTACEHANTAVGPIRFNSTSSLPLCLSFLPSSTVLLFFFFSPGLHLRPARSTYSLENDRSSVDFTRGGFSLGAASILSPLSPLLPPFFPPAFMQPDEGSRSSRIQFRLLSNYH